MNTLRPLQRPGLPILLLLSLCSLFFGTAKVCHGQYIQGPLTTTWPAIDQFVYIDSFQYDDGTGNDFWWNTGSSTMANGHIIYAYQDDNGGSSTVECDPATGTLVLWTIIPGNAGGTLSYLDGAASGHLGAFVLQSGAPALNKIIGINGVAYAATQNGSLLVSTATTSYASDDDPNSLWALTYGGVDYMLSDVRYDYSYRAIAQCNGGVTVISSTADLQAYPEQIAVGLPNGTVANYIGGDGMTYSYRPDSTAPNSLTKINGYALTTSGSIVSMPKPTIQSFVWNGNLFSFYSPSWADQGLGATPRGKVFYTYNSATAQQGWESPFNNGNICYALINASGTFVSLLVDDASADLSTEDETQLSSSDSVNFMQSVIMGNSSFTAINNHPYSTVGNAVKPLPPVATFSYDGKSYSYTNTTAGANNTFVTQYSGANGATATMTWSQATNEFVSMKIKPTSAAATATYTNGDAVGRPGAYVLSTTSTLLNKLTQVNATSFTPSGDAALPSGGYVNSNGVFDVQGNFMSLGQWSNDSTHVGFSLSYDDGTPVTVPATIEFTAGRSSTSWVWDAATSDDTGVSTSMQLDENSRLMLYPPSTAAVGAPAVPTPSIILDPNGVSRFDKPVRIAPQGDLQMGDFITEPAQ